MLEAIRKFLENPVYRWVVGISIGVLGLVAAVVIAGIVGRIMKKRKGEHAAFLGSRLVFYALFFVVLLTSLNILGVPMAGLITAAGVMGIAIAFAAQTTVSNIISGLFLIFERSFKVGDAIQVGDATGTVLSIDLLSTKIRTFDNQYVRIPNESLVKGNVTNLTRFDIRRADLAVGIAYSAPLKKALEAIQRCVDGHLLALRKPDPEILVHELADSGVTIVVRVWVERQKIVEAKSAILRDLKLALDEAGIEIPFPHRQLVADPDLLRAIRGGAAPPPGP